MSDKSNPRGRRSVGCETGLADHQPDQRLERALESLQLLNDKNNPMSLEQVIATAREKAEVKAEWERSGALIRDIVVRLADGKNIGVDQDNITTSLCGLHFSDAFPKGSVLHVCKKADEQFTEVVLLSVALARVPVIGFSYEKTYPNGQTLSMRIERHDEGQFYVSVDCTRPHAKTMHASPNRMSAWIPLIFALVGAASWAGVRFIRALLRDTAGSERMRHAVVYMLLIAMGCSLGMNLRTLRRALAQTQHPASRAAATKLGKDSHTSPVVATTGARSDDVLSPPDDRSGGLSSQQAPSAIAARQARKTIRAAAHPKKGQARPAAAVPADLSGAVANGGITAPAVPSTVKEVVTKPAGAIAAIYVQTDGVEDKKVSESLRAALEKELERSDRFVIVSDADAASVDTYKMVLRYKPKMHCHGVILAELYDGQGHFMWQSNKDCEDYPAGSMLEDASRELVSGILVKLTTPQEGGETDTKSQSVRSSDDQAGSDKRQ